MASRVGSLWVSAFFVASLLRPCLGDDTGQRTRNLSYDAEKRQWIEKIPPPPGSPEGDIHAMRVLIRDGEYRKALSGVKNFVKTYGETDPRYPEALLIKAEALVARKKYDEAHKVLLAFLGEFGGMSLTAEALRLEFLVAEAYLGGAKRKFLGMKILSGEDTAYRILDDISIDYPESALAEAAIKTKGDHFYRKGDYTLAELEYERMLKTFPTSRYHQYALGKSAESALASHGGVEYDESALIESEERYREYRRQYPGAAGVEGVGLILNGIREQRAEKEFITGAYYERTDHLGSATFYYELVVKNWPDTLAATKAAKRLTLIGPGGAVASAE